MAEIVVLARRVASRAAAEIDAFEGGRRLTASTGVVKAVSSRRPRRRHRENDIAAASNGAAWSSRIKKHQRNAGRRNSYLHYYIMAAETAGRPRKRRRREIAGIMLARPKEVVIVNQPHLGRLVSRHAFLWPTSELGDVMC